MNHNYKPLKTAILGSGNIGTDLLVKVMRSKYLTCSIFIGRNIASAGIRKANELGVRVSHEGIGAIQEKPDCCEVIFDATSALAHSQNLKTLQQLGIFVIDLTPSISEETCVPAINLEREVFPKTIKVTQK